jgi:hypothetical protein
MRNMSFMLTKAQMRNQTKTVTRRLGWKNLKIGEVIQAVEKCQGLKKGEKIKPICKIRVIDVRREELCSITEQDCAREGFPEYTPFDFVSMFCRTHKNCIPLSFVTRIEFEYLCQ